MAEDRTALLDFLARHYTLDGLKTLCFNPVSYTHLTDHCLLNTDPCLLLSRL